MIRIIKTIIRIILDATGLLPRARRIQSRIERELFTHRQNRLSQDQIEAIYYAQYHEKASYGKYADNNSGWESDAVIKLAHARAVLHILPDVKKVLVGGCSSGIGVLAFRQLGIEAWGFDISSDLERIVLPEVRNYVRRGSMMKIPFEKNDHFDCFVTTDVLEHVQLKDVKYMFLEMNRLNFRWMAHLINHTAIQLDHMTLKPLSWWEAKAAPFYRLCCDLKAPESGNPRIYGLNGDPLHVYTFWKRR